VNALLHDVLSAVAGSSRGIRIVNQNQG
jgi:hypothetical protein